MADPNKTSKERRMYEKSAAYPAVSISQSLDFVKRIDKLGGRSVSYDSVLKSMGLTSSTTKSFRCRLSASKQFGLIDTSKNTIQLTDLAKRILYPNAGKEESQKLLIEAFQNPPLYQGLIEEFNEKAVPVQSQLGNILMNRYRIIKQVKDTAAKCFIESADFLGLLENGVLHMDKRESAVPTNAESETQIEKNDEITNEVTETKKSPAPKDGYFFEIPTLGKATAKVYIPAEVTEKDIDYIMMYIENMLPAFLKNLKEEL